MKSPFSVRLHCGLPLLLGVLLAHGAPAQSVAPPQAVPADPTKASAPKTIPAPTTTTTPAAKSEEKIVELSPFTVNASGDVGYLAQNTLAGSRLNSSLRDTPGVLDVLTEEFLSDIGATTLDQALAFSANFAEDLGDFEAQNLNTATTYPSQLTGANFRTRGLGATLARNYLETDFRPTFYTTERIDNSSGPNSILFGLGSAGGVANISTKQAKLNRAAYGLDFMYDIYGSKRVTTDINQALIPKTLALRVNALLNRGQRYRANFDDNTNGLHLAGKWRVNDRTEIRVEYELEHTTGSVAYATPHIENVTNWIKAGSPLVTIPTNWETMTAAARTAFLAPFGLSAAGTGASPAVIQGGDLSYIINQATGPVSTGTNRQSIDPLLFNPRGNINGPAGSKQLDRQIFSVAVDHKFTDKSYLNLSAAHESGDAETYQAFANGAASGATIWVDPFTTLPNPGNIVTLGSRPLAAKASGQIINPHAGEFYTQSRWLHRTQQSNRKIVQSTLAGRFEFGQWLGSHRVVGTTSYSERQSGGESFRDSWLNAPFNNDPVGIPNGVMRRQYASPLEAGNFHVPDWRDFPVLTWNHPTRGPLTTGWITEGETRTRARQFTYLTAIQSHFINRRLVLTAGYRVDDATDYVFARKATFPPGYEGTTGIDVLDPTNVAKTNTRGPTRTLGGVFHLTHWLSAYGNRSSNFGSPRGTVIGPDAIVGPNTQGVGLDAGLKFSLLDNKVALDVGYFDTASNDVTEILNLNVRTAGSVGGAYNAVFNVLRNPQGTNPLFNPNDPATVDALKASYPLLRPSFNAQGDLLDQASRGYEIRLTANPLRGLRLRATFSKTSREREDLYKYTAPTAAQLRTYIADLQTKNPGVNVGSLIARNDTTASSINQLLNTLDDQLELLIANNSSNFGGGKASINFVGSYDFPGRLKGWGTTLTSIYRSGPYVGVYEVHEGGVASGKLLETVPFFGKNTLDCGLGLRYRTRINWLRLTSLTVQLNVRNLFDQSEPSIRRVNKIIIAPDAPRPTLANATVGTYFLREPRSWTLSTRFDF